MRALGAGAQATVHLARDTRLEREVALKTIRTGAGREKVRALLDEALMVSRLQHPHIVTLFDAGEEEGTPHLVFEYVAGRSLAAEIAAQGPLPPARAADIARQVLRGVAYAHARGIVHRDLKPANILLDGSGAARVTDFGIARHAGAPEGGEGGFYGTPAYLPPEYIEKREFGERGDVFAAGMVLYEMLTGAPAIRGSQVFEILNRMVREPFEPPSARVPGLDARLDAVVMRALAKDPAARYATATDMEEALAAWLDPAGEAQPGSEASGTLEFLLRRMRHAADFPSLSGTLAEVNRAVASEREPTGVLCAAILKDFALTNKLLRVVNAAHFRQFGGSISTVSRAIAILGQDHVRALALSLVLLDHLQNRAQAGELRDEAAAAYLAGVVARDLAVRAGHGGGEEAFICAMFRRLGKLLTTFYLHDEAQAIARLALARGIDEGRAAREVLGMGYAELGMGVARHWGFPEGIVRSMASLPPGEVSATAFVDDRRRALAEMANSLVDVVRAPDADARRKALGAVATRFRKASGASEKALASCLEESTRELVREAPALGLPLAASPLMAAARSLAGEPAATVSAAPVDTETRIGTCVLGESAATLVDAGAAPPDPADPARRRALLASGVQDITQTLVGEFALNDVLRMVTETFYRAIGFQRVLLCVREPSGRVLRARMGLGEGVDDIVRAGFEIPLAGARDVFFVALSKGADVAIENLDDEHIRAHVPDWYRSRVRARGMVLFPILVNRRPVALIYADADRPGVLAFAPEELDLLKTLRNQAVLALKQHG